MLSFRARKGPEGWVGCAPQGANCALALVQRAADGRPAVCWALAVDWHQPALALHRLRRSRSLLRHRRVALLQRSQYQCITMDAPADLRRDEWPDAVRWKLEEVVEFPVDSAAIDVLAVPEGTSYRAQPQLIAVAAPAAEVQPLVDHAADAGVPWHAVDIAETALRNLSVLVEPEGRSQALLHCDADHATLVVTFAGELLSARHFDCERALLASDDEDTRRRALDQLGLELQRSLDGIERSYGQVSLARLLVTPMAGADALCQHLKPLLYVPVEPLDLAQALDLSQVPELAADADALNRQVCAIGAALRPLGGEGG